jgi:hypothetical protein
MTVIFQFSSRFALRKPDITITHPAINPKTIMRLRPFLSGPTKLSKEPVPSAKAASAYAQVSRATIKAFRQLLTTHHRREGNLCFITKQFYNMYANLTIEKYVYFFCCLLTPLQV